MTSATGSSLPLLGARNQHGSSFNENKMKVPKHLRTKTTTETLPSMDASSKQLFSPLGYQAQRNELIGWPGYPGSGLDQQTHGK